MPRTTFASRSLWKVNERYGLSSMCVFEILSCTLEFCYAMTNIGRENEENFVYGRFLHIDKCIDGGFLLVLLVFGYS
jgi:hypothetical protein